MWNLEKMELEPEDLVVGLALVVLLLLGAFMPQIPGGEVQATRPYAHGSLKIQVNAGTEAAKLRART